MKLYNTIFQKSWKITKQNKVLWLFGFFLMLWAGRGMDFDAFFSNANLLAEKNSPFNAGFWQVHQWADVIKGVPADNFTMAAMIIGVIVLALFVFAVIMMAQAALVDGFATMSKTRSKSKRYTLDDGLEIGRTTLLPVAIVNIIGRLLMYGLLLVVALPVFLFDVGSTKFLIGLLLFLTVLPLTVIVSIVIKYAVNDIVIKKSTVDQALSNGWNMYVKNIGVSLELAVIMIFLYVTALAAVVVSIIVVMAPFILFGNIIASGIGATTSLFFLYVFGMTLGLFAVLAAAIVFTTWHWGNWTLLYLELTKSSKKSKVHRVLKGE